VNALDTALVAKLRGDSTLMGYLAAGTASIYSELAPQNAAHPLIVFGEQAEADEHTLTERAYEDFRMRVIGITEGDSMVAGGLIAERIFTVLNDAALSISGHALLCCRKEGNVRFVESAGGARFNHSGGVYRIVVR